MIVKEEKEMQKVYKLIFSLCLIALMGVSIVGCGQSTPTINTSNSQPNGLKIKGVIREYTLNGTVGSAIAGAVVALSGDSVNKTVVTNNAGEYVIDGIPDGSYNIVVTAEGYTRNRTNGIVIKPSSFVPADNTITVQDVVLSSNPIMTTISPTPNSIIGSSQAFTVTFNEPMDTSSVVFSLAPTGLRTFVASGTTVPVTVAWDSTNKVATVTPATNMVMNTNYSLSVSSSSIDPNGYAIATSADNALALAQSFRVATGGVAGTPGDIMVNYAGTTTLEAATFATAYGGGNADFRLYWGPATGNVTGYNIYVANSATGAYTWLTNSSTNSLTTNTNALETALYGNNSINPVSMGNFPLINVPLYVKVAAYNGDGESTAVVAGPLKFKKGPSAVEGHGWNNANFTNDKIYGNSYVLPRLLSTQEAYVGFDAPLDGSTVAAANFTITGGTVTAAQLMTNYTADVDSPAYWGGTIMSIVKITTNGTTVYGNTVEAGTAVKDLAGNGILSTATKFPVITN